MSAIKTVQRPEPHWLNKSAMAASLGISVQAFDKWGAKPIGRCGRSVYYTVADVVQNRVNNALDKYQPSGGDCDPEINEQDQKKSLTYERLRLTREQADGQALKNAKDRKEIVETTFCTFCLSRLSAEISSMMDTIPLAYRRRFPELEARHIEFLRVEIVKAQNIAAELDSQIPEYLDEYLALADH